MDQQTDDLIKKEIDNNEICLFMKGTPDAPQCGFSMAVSNMLKILEVNFKGVNVLEDEKLRQNLYKLAKISDSILEICLSRNPGFVNCFGAPWSNGVQLCRWARRVK